MGQRISKLIEMMLVTHYGITGVLYATVIALPVKIIYCNLLSDKVIQKRGAGKTLSILVANISLFLILAFSQSFFTFRIESFGQLILSGIVMSIFSVSLFLITNIIVNRDLFVYMLAILKRQRM